MVLLSQLCMITYEFQFPIGSQQVPFLSQELTKENVLKHLRCFQVDSSASQMPMGHLVHLVALVADSKG